MEATTAAIGTAHKRGVTNPIRLRKSMTKNMPVLIQSSILAIASVASSFHHKISAPLMIAVGLVLTSVWMFLLGYLLFTLLKFAI